MYIHVYTHVYIHTHTHTHAGEDGPSRQGHHAEVQSMHHDTGSSSSNSTRAKCQTLQPQPYPMHTSRALPVYTAATAGEGWGLLALEQAALDNAAALILAAPPAHPAVEGPQRTATHSSEFSSSSYRAEGGRGGEGGGGGGGRGRGGGGSEGGAMRALVEGSDSDAYSDAESYGWTAEVSISFFSHAPYLSLCRCVVLYFCFCSWSLYMPRLVFSAHAHAHAHTHTRTHMHAHTHTHTCKHANTHTDKHTQTHTLSALYLGNYEHQLKKDHSLRGA